MILKSTNLKSNLPHQGDKIYIADGGLETTFVFLKDIDLPHFAAFAQPHKWMCKHKILTPDPD